MLVVMHKNHKIEIKMLGKEKIFYDGKEVSNKWSVTGATHVFRVTEDGEDVQYDVKIGIRWHGFSWWCEVRRKGEIIYTDR
jgi:hypothetical protein